MPRVQAGTSAHAWLMCAFPLFLMAALQLVAVPGSSAPKHQALREFDAAMRIPREPLMPINACSKDPRLRAWWTLWCKEVKGRVKLSSMAMLQSASPTYADKLLSKLAQLVAPTLAFLTSAAGMPRAALEELLPGTSVDKLAAGAYRRTSTQCTRYLLCGVQTPGMGLSQHHKHLTCKAAGPTAAVAGRWPCAAGALQALQRLACPVRRPSPVPPELNALHCFAYKPAAQASR